VPSARADNESENSTEHLNEHLAIDEYDLINVRVSAVQHGLPGGSWTPWYEFQRQMQQEAGHRQVCRIVVKGYQPFGAGTSARHDVQILVLEPRKQFQV
jgi:hypothetical protein